MKQHKHVFMNPAILTAALLGTVVLAACGGDKPSPAATPDKQAVSTPAKPAPKKAALTPEQAGKKVFLRCQACHLVDDSGRHLVGPNLKGIFGKTSGTTPGFAYSDAMKNADIVWTETTIDEYMKKPMTYIKGNKMVFVGLPKEKDRKNLIAYLKAEAGSE